jgi:dolichyl-phosphate-mannose-protein mannosyltransferase
MSVAAPVAVLGLAGVLRLSALDHPGTLVFDESYYVKDALSLLQLGYEGGWPEDANEDFAAGTPGTASSTATFVAHPPLGKWVIALGMAALGPASPAGWRLGTALAGIAVVALVMLIAHRLFRSLALATLAGGLVAIDGNAIVMSRVALLDGVLTLFVMLAVLFVVLDREHTRRALGRWLDHRRTEERPVDWGPALWWRPWLVAAGAAFGLAISVKWSGLYLLAAFAVLTVAADAFDRRRAGVQLWASGTLLKQAPLSAVLLLPVALATHLLSWSGWFASSAGYDRQWIASGGERARGVFAWVPDALQNLWHYQTQVYRYHVGESSPHPYEAPAIGWPLLIRPTYMHYVELTDGRAESIMGIPNPLLWWSAVIAVVAILLAFVAAALRAERGRAPAAATAPFGSGWAIAVTLTGLAGSWLPWLLYPERTMFFFYTVVITPFLMLALVLAMRALLTRTGGGYRRTGVIIVSGFLVLAVVVSAFFLPVWMGWSVPVDYLRLHYWLPSWI